MLVRDYILAKGCPSVTEANISKDYVNMAKKKPFKRSETCKTCSVQDKKIMLAPAMEILAKEVFFTLTIGIPQR